MKSFSSYLDSHFAENFLIKEVGMKLIPEHDSRIRLRLQSLESRAPAMSSINLTFLTERNHIKGKLSINGANREFYSESTGDNPWEIYLSLEAEIDNQLLEWKRTRVLGERIDQNFLKNNQRLAGGYFA